MAKEKESTTKLKIDATEFKRGITEANRALRLANSEFKAATAGMDDWSKTTEGQQAKLKQLNAVMDAEKQKLSLIQEQYKKVAAAQGSNSAEAENLKIRLNNQQAVVNKAESELKNFNKKLNEADASTKNLTSSEQKADEETKKLSSEFSTANVTIGKLAADGLEKGAQKFLELADAAKQAFIEFDEGADNVIKATGATGEAADKLKTSYETVAKSVKGDFSDLGNIVGEINTRFGFVDERLEKGAITFKKFADITGADAKTAVQEVSKAMEKAGIDSDNYATVLDKLAYTSQATGIDVLKLTSSLSENGAAFKELGLDIDAQIGLLASFERGGVNVSSVLTGMKKAVGNWAKEGKNANVEFEKTMKLIQQAPNDTEAARIAVETFGTKSGVELANAMRTGKFSYEDFAQSLKKSSKTVENTYNATQDGLDKIDLAMQGLKVDVAKAFGELLDENEESIDDFINYVKSNVIPKGKAAVGWIIENFDKITTVAKGAATTIATIWVIKKSAEFAQVVSTTVSVITNLDKATDSAATSQKGLNAAQAASPIGAVATAAGLLIGGLKTLIDLSADNIDVIGKETDKYKELHDQIKKNADAWKEVTDSRDQNVEKAESEFDYLSKLKTELDLIVDKSGRVKAGYEDRAKFITDKLSEATGIEIQNNGKIIESYDKISDSIDKVIQKKRAQAIANANEDAYQTAVTNQDKYYDSFVKSLQTWQESDNLVNKTSNRMSELERLINGARASNNYANEEKYIKEYNQLKDTLKIAQEQKAKNWSAYTQAKATYEEAAATVRNYEALAIAMQSGDDKKITEAITNMKQNFKTAETSTKQTLQTQRDEYQKHYELLKSQLEKNTPGITKAMVDQAKDMCDKSVKELEKWEKSYSNAGTMNAGAYTSAYGSGLSSDESKQAVLMGVGNVTTWTQQEIDKAKENANESGKEWTGSFSTGMQVGGTLYGVPAAIKISDDVLKQFEFKAEEARAWGQKWAENYANAIKNFKVDSNLLENFNKVARQSASKLTTTQFAKNMNQLYGTGGMNSSSTTINNFYQTNNSPKALTPYETSRQTKNMLSQYTD